MVTLYSIHSNGVPAYLPENLWTAPYEKEQVTPTSAKLITEDNKSGYLTFSILKDNLAYDVIEMVTSDIKVTEYVYDDDGKLFSQKIIWKGRAISVEEDIYDTRSYTCEGGLAFLNDIVCYPVEGGWNHWIFDLLDHSDASKEKIKKMSAEEQKNMVYKYAIQNYLDTGGNNSGYSEGTQFKYTDYETEFFKECPLTYGNGYNYMCRPNRKITVGTVDIAALSDRGFHDHTYNIQDGSPSKVYPPTEYPNGVWSFQASFTEETKAGGSLDQILEMTVERNGGHLRMRYEIENGEEKAYLDYVGGYDGRGDPHSAKYGESIIDFTGTIELNAPITDIIPRGKSISTFQGENNFTIRDRGPFTEWIGIGNNGYKYGVHLVNEELAEKYGRIQQIVDFPDIEDPDELKEAGEEWLKTNSSFLYASYEVSILDLGRIYGNSIAPIHMLDLVHVVIPGKLDDYFPVTKLDIDLLDPANTTVTFSTTKAVPQTYSLRSGGADKTNFQKIRAGDSISEALANNLDKTNKLEISTNANTSLSKNVKDTNPEGKTGVVTVVTGISKSDEGELLVSTEDLFFVNGLLTSSKFKFKGPNYNFVSNHSVYEDIVFSGIVKPARDDYLLWGLAGMKDWSSITPMANPFYEQQFMLFGEGVQSIGKYSNFPRDHYKYPYRNVDETAELLTLDDDPSSRYFGEYYLEADGERRYVPVPCIYYIPTALTGDMYVLYINDFSKLSCEMTDDAGNKWTTYDGVHIVGKKIANIGYYTKSDSSTASTTIKPLMQKMVYKKFGERFEQDLIDKLKDLMPSYTSVYDMVEFPEPRNISSAALLIAPYYRGMTGASIDLFITPAIIEPVQYNGRGLAWTGFNIKGTTRYMPRQMRIYTGGCEYESDEYRYLPKNFSQRRINGERISTFDADMNLKTWYVEGSDIKTAIDVPKYYLFSSEADMLAVINAYKEGTLTQNEIEVKYRSNIRYFGNPYDTSTKSQMQMSYTLNGEKISYCVPGNNVLSTL